MPPNQVDWAKAQESAKIRPLWPDQAGRGAHINISGAGVAKHSKNRAAAVKLIELLRRAGAEVAYHDPHIPEAPRMRSWPDLPPMRSEPLTRDTLKIEGKESVVTLEKGAVKQAESQAARGTQDDPGRRVRGARAQVPLILDRRAPLRQINGRRGGGSPLI